MFSQSLHCAGCGIPQLVFFEQTPSWTEVYEWICVCGKVNQLLVGDDFIVQMTGYHSPEDLPYGTILAEQIEY